MILTLSTCVLVYKSYCYIFTEIYESMDICRKILTRVRDSNPQRYTDHGFLNFQKLNR